MWNLKKTQPTSEQNKKEANSHIYVYIEREQTYGHLWGEGSGRGSIRVGGAKGCYYVIM